MTDNMDAMFKGLAAGPAIYQPSLFWEQLNEQNVAQLESEGLENLKRTLAQNYFTWVVGMRSPLFKNMVSQTRPGDWPAILANLPAYDRSWGLSLRRFYELHVFTRMTWLIATKHDRRGLLNELEEPSYGNPFPTHFKGRLISQDLANSVLELYSITEGKTPGRDEAFTVCELGAGYGRNAFIFLSAFSRCKYIIVDIPPALYVSQEYISQVLPDKKVMRFRDEAHTQAWQDEFAEADIAFLLPHQAEALADRSVDYFVNISSFHEMKMGQIEKYFELANRLSRQFVYIKQWNSFDNTRDGITISHDDYPVRPSWTTIFDRTPATHPLFFEALFRV